MTPLLILSTLEIEIINTTVSNFDVQWKEKQSLKSVYQYWPKTILFDNHNHALYYWAEYSIRTNQTLPVIHIDQHSDLSTPPLRDSKTVKHTSLQDRKHIAYSISDIWSFIVPALEWNLISSCEQIRTETKLNAFKIPQTPYILDIDLDFRAPEMINDYIQQTIQKTRDLITQASFITIATSPGYIDQEIALEILAKIMK